MMLSIVGKSKAELINPAEYLTLTQVAEELGVHRSRIVQFTDEDWHDGRKRLPTREFFGVKVIHVGDLERVRDRTPGKPRQKKDADP